MTPITLNFGRLDMSNYHLARNLTTSPETLARLANDYRYYVRYWVAINPNTPPETLKHMANDKNYWVRCTVADNPNTPQYVKTYLKLAETVVELAQ